MTAAMIEALDAEIGRMIAEVRRRNPNVYVILVGDNGTDAPAAQGPPGGCFDPERSKGTLYQAGIRVPLIIAGPDVVSGESQALVSAVDLFATITELARVPRVTQDSVSLVPYLEGDVLPRRSTVYAETFVPNFVTPDAPGMPPFVPRVHTRAIRNERYKLIRWSGTHQAEDEQFFDLWLDPCESVDLCPGPGPCDGSGLMEEELENLLALQAELAAMGVY
jgi:arylsulfatase A-like enzyme